MSYGQGWLTIYTYLFADPTGQAPSTRPCVPFGVSGHFVLVGTGWVRIAERGEEEIAFKYGPRKLCRAVDPLLWSPNRIRIIISYQGQVCPG